MDEEQQARTLSATGSGNSQLYRELRWKNSQLRKACGKQGTTIHQLRAELAEVRELNSKIERGEIRRLERENRSIAETYREVVEENRLLQEKLEAVDPHDDDGNRVTPA